MRSSSQFSQAELRKHHEHLDRLENGNGPEDILIDNAEFIRRFGISYRTSYNWRRKSLLKFLYIEKKIFYRLSEIREFLNRQERNNEY